jgi:hypothetical protein
MLKLTVPPLNWHLNHWTNFTITTSCHDLHKEKCYSGARRIVGRSQTPLALPINNPPSVRFPHYRNGGGRFCDSMCLCNLLGGEGPIYFQHKKEKQVCSKCVPQRDGGDSKRLVSGCSNCLGRYSAKTSKK